MNNSKAYFWGILSRFAPQGIYLITTMILARFLTPDDFGMIGVLSVIFLVANILLDSGLGGSLIQEKEIKDIDCSTISIFNISIASIIYVILFLFSSRLESFFAIEGLAGIVKTISLVFPITAFGIVPSTILKRELKFKQIFISTLIGVILASMISIFAA
ncbi:MAG: oligosaccharide flippase family protein, partial [Segatella copri]